MRKWLIVMICVFLYVMPVHATQLSEETTGEAVIEEVVSQPEAESEEVVQPEAEESAETPQPEAEESEETPQPEAEESEETPQPEAEESAEMPQPEVEESAEASQPVTGGESSSDEAGNAENEADVEDTEQDSEKETATEETTEEATEETTETVDEEAVEVTIPDVSGLMVTQALEILTAIVLPDGSQIEIIKEYLYTEEAEKDIVFKQSPLGVVSEEEAKKVYITVSLGKDPNETMVTGIEEPLNQTINSQYGINWGSLPEHYEYVWDNSQNCWVHGVWIDGVKYLTPQGTYNTNVRHLIQLYSDDKYVYTHVVFSRDYGARANGNWYQYFVDGQMAAFNIEMADGTSLANNNLSPGSYKVVVRHASGDKSHAEVPDAEAYYTVFDSKVNSHLEIRIPLSEMAAQNSNISLDTVGTIGFFTPNLMMSVITIAGAGTAPLTTAAVTLVLVPATAVILKKKRKTAKKEINV